MPARSNLPVALLILLGIALTFVVTLTPLVTVQIHERPVFAELLRGLLASTPLVLGALTALGRAPVARRYLWAVLTGVVLSALFNLHLVLQSHEPTEIFSPANWSGVMVLAGVAIAAFLWPRFFLGLRFYGPRASASANSPAATPPHLSDPAELLEDPPASLGEFYLTLGLVCLLLMGGAYLLVIDIHLHGPPGRNYGLFLPDALVAIAVAVPALLMIGGVLHAGVRLAWFSTVLPVAVLAALFAAARLESANFSPLSSDLFFYALGSAFGTAAAMGFLMGGDWRVGRAPVQPRGPIATASGRYIANYGALVILLLLNLLTTLYAWPLARNANFNSSATLFWCGSIFITVVLLILAAWTGLALPPLRVRLPAGLMIGLGLCYYWSAIFKAWFQLPIHAMGMLYGLIVLTATFLFLFALCQRIRGRYGLRLLAPAETLEDTATRADDRQFSLGHLLMWTTAAAVLLAATRAILGWPIQPLGNPPIGWQLMLLALGTLAICGGAIAPLTVVGAVLHEGRGLFWFRIGLATSLISSLLISVGLCLSLFLADNLSHRSELGLFVVIVAFTAFFTQFLMQLAMLLPLLVLKLLGWRIVRLPRAKPTAPPAGP